MSKDTFTIGELSFQPLTMNEWGDFERLFNSLPACQMCWCMYWRTSRTRLFGHADQNKQEMHAVVNSGVVAGLLAYKNGQPVGWCSVAPREDYPGLDRSPTLKAIDDQPVWSITCLVVAKAYRRQGMNLPLIQGAVDYAASHGARIIEAYPFINPRKKNRMVGEAFMGFASTFQRLGFQPVSDRSKVRNIMRLYLH